MNVSSQTIISPPIFTMQSIEKKKFAKRSRENQLETLRSEDDLWKRITFWLSDFLCFSESSIRLESYPHDDPQIHLYIGSFYFSKKEAKRITNLKMMDGLTLEGALQRLMEEKAADGQTEVCTSHHIYPLLCKAFDFENPPFKSKLFKASKKKWIKERMRLH